LQVIHSDNNLSRELARVADNLREAYQSVRQSVHGLHDEAFDLDTQLMTLAQETEQSVNDTERSTRHIKVNLNYELNDEQPSQVISYSLLAIVKESLANCIKHSNADEVKIQLTEFPGFYQLIVKDNGSIPPKPYALTNTSGIGLAGMEERTRSLGGAFNTSYAQGFRVFASIPKE